MAISLTHLYTVGIILVWYCFACTTAQTTKFILDVLPYPSFLILCQFSANLIYGLIIVYFRPKVQSYISKKEVAPWTFEKAQWLRVIPLATFQFLGKFFSVCATVRCTVAAVSSVKSLTPLLTVFAYRIAYGVQFAAATYLTILPLVAGVIMIVLSQEQYTPIGADDDDPLATGNGGSEFNTTFMVGVFLAFLSCCMFTGYSIFGKNIVTDRRRADGTIADEGSLALSSPNEVLKEADVEMGNLDDDEIVIDDDESFDLETTEPESKPVEESKPDKLATMIYAATWGVSYVIPIFLIVAARQFFGPAKPNYTSIPIKLLFINTLTHFFQSFLNFYALSILPTVTFSIVNMIKKIVIISVSMIITTGSLHLGPRELAGLSLISVGLYAYDRWGSKGKS